MVDNQRKRENGQAGSKPVNEQQNVLVLDVTEVFRHGQAGQGYAHTNPWRFVHLTEDKRGVLQHTHLLHFQEEVSTLTGALADSSEHGGTGEVSGNTGNHFLNQHGLADTSAAEQADLAAFHVRREQVNDLDSGFQNLGFAFQFVEWWRIAMDSPLFAVAAQAWFVQALTECVEHVALHTVSNRNADWAASIGHLGTTDESVGRSQGNGTDQVIAEVLCNLKRDGLGDCLEGDLDSQRVIQSRHRSTRKFHVDDRTGDAHDAAGSVRATLLRVLLIKSCSHDLVTFSAAGKRTSATDDLVDFLGNLCLTSLVSNT